MTALRLRGTCPECGFIERLRPDGTMVQHTRRWRVCKGTSREPVAGSVAAWLDAQDAMARAGSSARSGRWRKRWLRGARERARGRSDEGDGEDAGAARAEGSGVMDAKEGRACGRCVRRRRRGRGMRSTTRTLASGRCTGHADVAVLTWQQALDALGLSPVTMRTAAFIAASAPRSPRCSTPSTQRSAARRGPRGGGAAAAELADHHTASVLPRETALRETAEALGFTHMGAGLRGDGAAPARRRDRRGAQACAAICDDMGDAAEVERDAMLRRPLAVAARQADARRGRMCPRDPRPRAGGAR